MRKKRLFCSFSGGNTSAWMTKWCMDNLSDEYEIKVGFANTSEENEKTLIFVNNCDLHWGFNSTWIEAVPFLGERKGSGHRIVTFDTASRNGEPFEKVIEKYGIPNQSYPHCTRELKLNPIKSYLNSIGWEFGSYETAIGIRIDEKRRVSKNQEAAHLRYVLIDDVPMDKQDIEDAVAEWPFHLGLESYQGNCKTCWKKSYKKLYRIAVENPEYFDFNRRMESLHGKTGAGMTEEGRVFFRMKKSTNEVLQLASIGGAGQDINSDGGCSESCELFETEIQE